MAQPENTIALKSALKTYFEREILTGPNFNEWHRALRIVLRVLGGTECLTTPMHVKPDDYDANKASRTAYDVEYKRQNEVAVLMLGRMNPVLQHRMQFEQPH